MEGAAKEYEGHSDQQVSNNNKNGEDDYGDWIKVQNKRKKERSDGTYNRRSVFERLSINKPTSFFFTRFPESWDSRTLWKIFEEYGKIVDVYIPDKRTKMGTRFGFARFVNISDVQAFEKKLGEIQVGKTKLLINIAKYGREKENTNKEVKKVVTEVQKNNHIHMGAKYNGRSYREVTTGSTPIIWKWCNSIGYVCL
ncbi:serine/arginine-rich splicing factor 2 [Artemisia annua]|uniref:Serine/arginine-rich splicing factor 2 n=1 Tax=Artemisia annua TaxID=35608 RepID=A0A2U1LMV5_ARTAN|nr:serine/arginine-rich splicing factor 2 [Artemisia annua]